MSGNQQSTTLSPTAAARAFTTTGQRSCRPPTSLPSSTKADTHCSSHRSDAKASTNGYSNNNHQSFRDAGEAQQYVDQGGAYSKQDWAQSQGGYSPNGYNPSGSSGNAKK
ncbi:hypothetical protein A4X09_0g5027 [Tilletia walkeri]|uniref:Uncharacterized protein n=1 Tax=Tilletia walkeri TaxID=117179 RepID=A0A8X7N642_9BASI|nr:hypothetical protein A4X09_0g5027 [Tilletia walkeri]